MFTILETLDLLFSVLVYFVVFQLKYIYICILCSLDFLMPKYQCVGDKQVEHFYIFYLCALCYDWVLIETASD